MEIPKRCWAEIDIEKLLHNYRLLKKLTGHSKLIAVVKTDAYGCGIIPVSLALEEFEDDWLGVASLEEALTLRSAGIKKPVLIFGYVPPEAVSLLNENNLTATIVSAGHGFALEKACAEKGIAIEAHVKLDTGMTRIGEIAYGSRTEEALEKISRLYNSRHLNVSGIYTHLSSTYVSGEDSGRFTALQFSRFTSFIDRLTENGISPGMRHCCNTAATVSLPEYHLDMCRVGTVLYGIMPPDIASDKSLDFKPVLELKSRVIMVKDAEAGYAVSYDRKIHLDKPTRIAVISCGYGDGYKRALSCGVGRVLIRGKFCTILGLICMDMFMVDITGAEDVREGDEAVLVGAQGENSISCAELGSILNTGPSEISVSLLPRVERIYLNNPSKA